jgi:hypothetical protein
MRPTNFLWLLSFLVISFSCSDEDDNFNPSENLIRSIAYNSLSDEEKATIIDDWEEAEVIYGTFKSDVCDYAFMQENQGRICFFPKDQSLVINEDQRLAAVIFNTVNDPLLGPILVIVDPELEAAVGYGLRL